MPRQLTVCRMLLTVGGRRYRGLLGPRHPRACLLLWDTCMVVVGRARRT
ncbi:hypothetical protein [Lapillicoccus sp.]